MFNSTIGPVNLTDTWITPKWIIDKLGGPESFDLDPCGFIHPDKGIFVQTAKNYFTENQDGLTQEWYGNVFLNFPYSKAKEFFAKMKQHNQGIVLCFARTETQAWQNNVKSATGLLFLSKRIKFLNQEGVEKTNGNAPSVLIAYGESNYQKLKAFDGILARIDHI